MVRINLLPVREILRKRELKQFAIMAGSILAGVVLVMVLAYVLLSGKVGGLEAERDGEKKKLAELQKKNEEINKLKSEIAGLERQRDTVKQLTQTRDTPAPFMYALSLAVPDEVWMTSIDKTGKAFSLQGQGMDNTVVVKFVENLQKVRVDPTPKRPFVDPASSEDKTFFSGVKLVQTTRGAGGAGPGDVQFSITGTIR